MGAHSSLSLPGVTKLPFQSRPAKMTTILYTCQSATSTTKRAKSMGMALFFLASLPFQRVSLLSFIFAIALLIVPLSKAEKKFESNEAYRTFKQQLFHDSLCHIFSSLKPGMVQPEILRCPDGHLRRVIFGLGPYIADYPEQVLVSGIRSGWCPR